jgi:hypothetical protein
MLWREPGDMSLTYLQNPARAGEEMYTPRTHTQPLGGGRGLRFAVAIGQAVGDRESQAGAAGAPGQALRTTAEPRGPWSI